jgi:hypothetical protein
VYAGAIQSVIEQQTDPQMIRPMKGTDFRQASGRFIAGI